MTRLRLALITLSVVVVSLAVLPPGGAHTFNARTRMTKAHLHPDEDRFHGVLRSPKDACQKRRYVEVYSEGGHVWGTDYTNAKGKWRTSPIEDPPDQNYTAIAFEVTLKDGGSHSHRCKTASREVASHG